MSNSQPTSVSAVLIESLVLIAAWAGSVTLAEVQTFVAIVSGLVLAGYAATQWFVLWRDKIKGKRE